MRFLIALVMVLFANGFDTSQAHSSSRDHSRTTGVRYAEGAALKALDFAQGDLASLLDAKGDFTAKGWDEFMKKLEGWLNPDGAPKFSSSFVQSGDALDIHEERGVLYLTVPGVLRQEVRNAHGGVSATAYRAEIDVQFAERLLKIERLTQRTCGGAKTKMSCR